jgi:hypothetical protein
LCAGVGVRFEGEDELVNSLLGHLGSTPHATHPAKRTVSVQQTSSRVVKQFSRWDKEQN